MTEAKTMIRDVEDARKYLDRLAQIRAAADAVSAGEEPVFFGEAKPSEAAVREVREALQNLRREDHFVSFLMIDAATLSGAGTLTDVPFCSQSTIKAVYVGSLLEGRPEVLRENGPRMNDSIVYSDNEAYESLREIYGNEFLRKWCQEAGVDESMAEPPYPRDKTVKDLLKLWTRLYAFLNGTREDALSFADCYADSIASATNAALKGIAPVHTKAGWECGLDESMPYNPDAVIPDRFRDKDPLNDECSLNDSGVVYTQSGPYFFVIYTDYPFGVFPDHMSPNPLPELASALYRLQQSYAGEKQ